MTQLTHPGVYVEEAPSYLFSVKHRPTAIPAFFSADSDFTSIFGAVSFVPLMGLIDVDSAIRRAGSTIQTAYESSTLVRAMLGYFANGGGRCYVLNGDGSNVASVVKALPDVTLLVQAGVSSSSALFAQICTAESGIFGLYDVGSSASSEFGAAYGPALVQGSGSTLSQTMEVSPSAVMAGIYCRVDRDRGVWKAPANVPVQGNLRPTSALTDTEIGSMYSSGPVNAIRAYRGSPPVVWGARTQRSDDNFRYVPVQRLFNSVRRDIMAALSCVVYEPNCLPTWERVRAMLDRYLYDLWKAGALLGYRPDDAYTVALGLGVTMDEADVANGILKVKIGLAAVRPAEFIELNITQDGPPRL